MTEAICPICLSPIERGRTRRLYDRPSCADLAQAVDRIERYIARDAEGLSEPARRALRARLFAAANQVRFRPVRRAQDGCEN